MTYLILGVLYLLGGVGLNGMLAHLAHKPNYYKENPIIATIGVILWPGICVYAGFIFLVCFVFGLELE